MNQNDSDRYADLKEPEKGYIGPTYQYTTREDSYNNSHEKMSGDDLGLGIFKDIPSPAHGRGFEFIDAIKVCINKSFTLKGRACRSELWWFFLGQLLISMILAFIPIIGQVISLLLTVSLATATVRRLHDRGLSGLLVLLTMIPYFLTPIIMIIAFILFFIGIAGGASGEFNHYQEIIASAGIFLVAFMVIFAIVEITLMLITIIVCILPANSDTNKYGTNPLL